jgi:hypothetical protein
VYFVCGCVAKAAVKTEIWLAAHGEGVGGVAACPWTGGLRLRDCLVGEGRHIKSPPRFESKDRTRMQLER